VTDVIIRLSLGYNDIDQKAASYANGAMAQGIRVGYYHFAYPDTKSGGTVLKDAKNEANYFTSLFQAGQLPTPNRLAVDLEMWKESPPQDSPLGKADYLAWVKEFLSNVYSVVPSVPCLIYGSAGYLDAHLPTAHGLGSIPLWVAHYTANPSPKLPKGWTNYDLWQYTDVGGVDGITGFCDMNRTRYSAYMVRLTERLKGRRRSRR
jgi:lysozyme